MNKRARIEMMFTVKPEDKDAIKTSLGDTISRRYGGVTIDETTGYWRTDGNSLVDDYEGEMTEEIVLKVILGVMTYQEKDAIILLKKTVNAMAVKYKGFTAIHLETYATQSGHFLAQR